MSYEIKLAKKLREIADSLENGDMKLHSLDYTVAPDTFGASMWVDTSAFERGNFIFGMKFKFYIKGMKFNSGEWLL